MIRMVLREKGHVAHYFLSDNDNQRVANYFAECTK